MSIGHLVLEKLKKEINQNEYKRYIKNLRYDEKSSRGDIAIFTINNILAAKWIKTHYAKKIAHLFEIESGIAPQVIIDT
ncbi:MAG TPA: chromosomal replication initiator protein DnaA, partial [Nitratifractor sp.]|nr:chromosomal replication initiator protein DnaA [Nitratifractor sp.]